MSLFGHRASFEARLSTLVALAVGVTIALAALASYLLVDHQLRGQVQSSLQSYAQSVNDSTFGPGAVQSAVNYADSTGDRVQLVLPSGQVYVPDPSGECNGRPGACFLRAQRSGAAFSPTSQELAVAAGKGPSVLYSDQTIGHVRYRVVTIPVAAKPETLGPFADSGPPLPAALQIGRSLSDIDRALADLRIIIALVTGGGVAAALAIGTMVARTTIRPVTRLTATAEHVAATQDLDATIEVDSDDELGRLAQAFNSMLTALRLSREQQAQLVSDAGHELRTPLTSLRTNIEFLMKARAMPEADRAALLTDVQDQLEELTSLVGDIVETARADEHGRIEPTETRLDAIVDRALERARRRAPSLRFDVALTPGSVRAQPPLLERAVLNVLDNAAKWSPPGGTVEVRLTRGPTWVLEVRDHGPGIDEADLPHVFERFYRAATARAMPGSGLGLAIVRNVVADHGGTVEAELPAGGGTLVRITLPTVEEDEPVPPAAWSDHPPAPPEPRPRVGQPG